MRSDDLATNDSTHKKMKAVFLHPQLHILFARHFKIKDVFCRVFTTFSLFYPHTSPWRLLRASRIKCAAFCQRGNETVERYSGLSSVNQIIRNKFGVGTSPGLCFARSPFSQDAAKFTKHSLPTPKVNS